MLTTRLLIGLVTLAPLVCIADDLSAVGFVEKRGQIRLAFAKTSKGWGPSCFFVDQNAAPLSDGAECARSVMAKPWSVLDAKGGSIEIGSLKPRKNEAYKEAGLVGFALPQGMKLELDRRTRFTWEGKARRPLLAVPVGTKVTKLRGEPIRSLRQEERTALITRYLEGRVMRTCTTTPEYQVHERPATPQDVNVNPLRRFSGSIAFYDLSLKIPADSQCDVVDPEHELLVVKGSRTVNLAEPLRQQDAAFSTSPSLFDAFQLSTGDQTDTLFILLVSGYNRDGYALVDSELRMPAISMWGYH